MAAREMTVHDEDVGEPRDGKQDNVFVRVTYRKGVGYMLSGRVQRTEGDGLLMFLMFNGITHQEMLLQAKRFGQKKLATVTESARGSDQLKAAVVTMKAELARRIAAGEDY